MTFREPATEVSPRDGAAAPADRAALFLHNMRALWQFDGALALRVDAVEDEERLEVEPARSGAWTVKMPTEEGGEIYLHSRHDPEAEAERFAAPVTIEDKFCVIVSGLGLGYHVRALFNRLKGDSIIVCTEPSIRLIATALTCVDLADLIRSGRLIILTDDDKSRLHERLQPFNTLIMLGAEFVKHPASMRVAGRRHHEIIRVISEFVTYTRMTLTTLVANARITCQNIAMNFVNYVTTPPIDLLHHRFADDPAIVISAGPSLAAALDILPELKGRAVLIAVQTVLKPLLERGIVPDFVTSLDFHEVSKRFFESVDGLEDVHLVAEPKATWHVVDHYPGPVSLLDNGWARLVLGDELGQRGGLPAGATVSHLAFYLAAYMGCNPIILVGQDLAFTGHTFYTPGVEIHRTWSGELNRFNTIEQKEWDRIVRNRPILRRVQGVDGAELYTDELLFTYLEQFEKDIAQVPNQVINVSRRGARIRGTVDMDLPEAASRLCVQPIEPSRFAYRDAVRGEDRTQLPTARQALERRLDELDQAVALCEELLTLLGELRGLTDDPQRFNRRLIRVDELRTKVHTDSRAYQIINHATQLAELKRFSADRRISAQDLTDEERAVRQIERDTEFISAVRDGAVDVKKLLEEALERIVTRDERA